MRSQVTISSVKPPRLEETQRPNLLWSSKLLDMQWMQKAANQGHGNAVFTCALRTEGYDVNVKAERFVWIRDAAVSGGGCKAQHIMGLSSYESHMSDTVEGIPLLEVAQWFRTASRQGLKEAKWELGEMFRRGLFCGVRMHIARKYIRRASTQGHAEVVERMKELRRCLYCAATDAPLACSLCRRARYCDSTCSWKQWRHGGGVEGDGNAPHKETCPRNHNDPSAY